MRFCLHAMGTKTSEIIDVNATTTNNNTSNTLATSQSSLSLSAAPATMTIPLTLAQPTTLTTTCPTSLVQPHHQDPMVHSSFFCFLCSLLLSSSLLLLSYMVPSFLCSFLSWFSCSTVQESPTPSLKVAVPSSVVSCHTISTSSKVPSSVFPVLEFPLHSPGTPTKKLGSLGVWRVKNSCDGLIQLATPPFYVTFSPSSPGQGSSGILKVKNSSDSSNKKQDGTTTLSC